MVSRLRSPAFWALLIVVVGISQSRFLEDDGNEVTSEEAKAMEFLDYYDEEAARLMNIMTIASWNYETNITDHNAEIATEAGLEVKYSSSVLQKKVWNSNKITW